MSNDKLSPIDSTYSNLGASNSGKETNSSGYVRNLMEQQRDKLLGKIEKFRSSEDRNPTKSYLLRRLDQINEVISMLEGNLVDKHNNINNV